MRYLKFLAEKKSWNWEFSSMPQFSWEALQGAAAVKVAPVLSKDIVPQLKILPTQVRALQCVDSFFSEDGSWYPRLVLQEALRNVLIKEARDLDIRVPAFVVGHNEEARVASAVLAEMGISEIYLVGEIASLRQQQDILSRSQLGIRFHILPPQDLTLQAVSSGIVINTVDLSQDRELLVDLSYFNFMKADGYVLDLNLLPLENLLLEEAQKAELRVLSPVLIAEEVTRLWLKRLSTEPVSDEEIHETWQVFLQNPG